MRCGRRSLVAIAVCVGSCVFGLLVWQMALDQAKRVAADAEYPLEQTPYPNCRFGVTAGLDAEQYDMPSLNVGWYLNWRTLMSPPEPGGAEFYQVVRLTQEGAGYIVTPPTTTLISLVDAHPGAVWLIGNEPDGYGIAADTDSIDPRIYARAYHDLYHLIKDRDVNAQVGSGAIIQPTPLRFAYLDTVWDTFYATYSTTMPVDIWSIHSFILRETTVAPDPDPCGENTTAIWGAYVPRGSLAQTGELYCIRDQDNLEIFWQRIRTFRQWMAEKGQREKPLIITEYGVLFPEDYSDEDGRQFDQTRVGSYMQGTFDLMLNETDASIGYPYDDNRLVQRWAWFSLSENPYTWGGTLFNPSTGEMRELGQYFQDYTSAITPTVDLFVVKAYATPAAFWQEDVPVTATVKAVISNIGNISTTLPVTVAFFEGPADGAGGNPIGEAQVIVSGLGGCATYEIVEMEWPGLGTGAHRFHVKVMGSDGDPVDNNLTEGFVLVASQRSFFPVAFNER